MNDLLLEHLLELEKEFNGYGLQLIVGGGLSLYLRQVYKPTSPARYPFDAETRSTDDIDLFLNSEIIVNPGGHPKPASRGHFKTGHSDEPFSG